MPRYVLALDQGTTSSRALLFDEEGRPVGMAKQEFSQIYPQPGWVEHAPEDLWASQAGVVAKLLRQCGASASDIAALGIANQRETTILWERATGRPVANAIVWQDRRTAPLCERLRADGLEPLFRERTGLPLDPYFSGTKIRWLLDNIAGLRPRAGRGEIAFGTVDTFLLWRLTGGAVHATDPSNASRTLLYNLHTGGWDDELLSALDIPRELLPEIRPTSSVYGETLPDLFGAAIPIGGMAGDQQAATFGQACLSPGMAKNTYGTGCFLLLNTGPAPRPSQHGLLTTVAWQLEKDEGGRTKDESDASHSSFIPHPSSFALEGSVFVAGAAVQWLRDELQIIRTSDEIEGLAASVPDSAGVTFVPAFVGLGTPHWDPHARGAILGLTRGAGRGHLARAALEAVCFQTRDVLEAMRQDGGPDLLLPELRADGGMTRNTLLLQMQADLLGVPVARPQVTETTALGAAYFAGLAVGLWPDTAALAAQWRRDALFEPQLSLDARESRYADWQAAVARVRTGNRQQAVGGR